MEKRLAHLVATTKTTITLPSVLLNQAKTLAKTLNISQNHLFQFAIEQFIEEHQPLVEEMSKLNPSKQARAADQDTITGMGDRQFAVNQGDIYWLQLEESGGAQPEIRHPHIVIQENVFNHSRIHTVVVCALTSNLKRANFPGNVLLEANEANLPKQSVVEISKVSTVNKAQLGEYIGSLSEERINQILAGLRFLHLSFFARPG